MSETIRNLFSPGTMQVLATCVLFVAGLALIVKGGDLFVDAATWMAEASGIPKFIIGATIVSVATTLPELIVSTLAAAEAGGAESGVSMAVGNAIGSVTANTGLIMGLSLIFAPLAVSRSQIGVKSALLLSSIGLLMLLCWDGRLTLWEAALVLLLFALFIGENVWSASKDKRLSEDRPALERGAWAGHIAVFALGAAMLALGSNLLVDNGEYLAVDVLGVPTRIVAITMVAIGTSLPELVTAITALVKKQGSMSVGNIIGANIIDITIILPLCAFISGGSLPIADLNCVRIDMPICLLEAAIALIPTLIRKKFSRWQGVLMVALYAAYLVFSVGNV